MRFINLKVVPFVNKNTGQISVNISRKKLKKMKLDLNKIPKHINLKITKW